MKTARWLLLLAGVLSITGGCQYEEADSTSAATGLETRGEALSAPAGTWAWNASSSLSGRYTPTVTLLRATGEVLMMEHGLRQPERYDPYANAWRLAAREGTSREQFTATQLPSGLVLVAGGKGPTWEESWLRTASLYDPATDTWLPTGSMNERRGNHTATLLDSGQVLVVGGNSLPYYGGIETDSAELYDPETGTWSRVGSSFPRSHHAATLLYSGKVLLTGGYNSYQELVFPTALLYDPASKKFSQIGDMPRARADHLSVRLYSDNVMLLGGSGDASVDMYDPYNDLWFPGPSLPISGPFVTATMLYSGEVLVTNDKAQAVLYAPAANEWLPVTNMNEAHNRGHRAVLLHTGQVFIAGGSTTSERFTR